MEKTLCARARPRSSSQFGARVQQVLVPTNTVPEKLVVAKCVLYRIVDDGHQWQHGVKGDNRHNGHDQEPRAVVEGFVHGDQALTSLLST